MKKILLVLILPVAVILLGGCSKDFLTDDNQENLTRAKVEELMKKPTVAAELLNNKLNSVYKLLYQETGVSRRDDVGAGMRFTCITMDFLCNDVVLEGRCWGLFDYMRDFYNPAYYRVAGIWNKFYTTLGEINSIINNDLPPDGNSLSDPVKPVYGQVYILRAVCYYYLVNIFQMPYCTGTASKPGVPLVLKGTDEEISHRATVQEVYDQIISDLKKGVEFAGPGTSKSQANKDVAYAFLTRVYLEMGKYADAVASAKAVFGGKPTVYKLPEAANMGFGDLNQADHMWGYYVNSETTIFFGSVSSIIDNTGNGYPSIGCPVLGYNAMVDELGPKDKRHDWFGPGYEPGTPEYAQYVSRWGGDFSNAEVPYVGMKYYSAKDFTADVIYLRYSDAYLMLLEAMQANGDSEDQIRALLQAFVRERDPEYDCSYLSGDDLRDAIRYQRRVDLWLEGVSWFDYRRWQIPIDRSAPGKYGKSNHKHVLKVVKPGEDFYAFPIPLRELQQNPGLKPQHPTYNPN